MVAEEVLVELAQARRNRRASTVDWWDRIYHAYLTVIGIGIGIISAASFVGDDEVAASTLRRIGDDGPWVAGIVCALVVVAGARSGARGGPLTLEAPFVQHVLLAPVDRDRALRGPAARQLGNALVAGAVAGGAAGIVAAERLPVGSGALVGGGAAAGAATTVTAVGLALTISGQRASMRTALGVAVPIAALVGIAAGRVALAGVDADPVTPVIAVAAAGVLALVGLTSAGGISIESAQRRAGLVSSLRLAVTRQDLRAVVLLHRRLSLDRARATPWFRIPSTPSPVFDRGVASILRLPSRRLVRMTVLMSVSALAAWGAIHGTAPLIVLAALALHAVALDANEALAQETDHPTRWGSYPIDPGTLLLQHLVAPAILIGIATIPLAIAAGEPIAGVTAPIAAVTGAAASVMMPPFEPWARNAFVPPESIGLSMIIRVVWPVVVTGAGLAPILAGPRPVPLIVAIVAATVTWLRAKTPVRS